MAMVCIHNLYKCVYVPCTLMQQGSTSGGAEDFTHLGGVAGVVADTVAVVAKG